MMDNNKSMGYDNINPFLLKLALPYIVEPLTYIYNLSILNNVFLTTLKKAKVIPLPKTNDLSEPNNFSSHLHTSPAFKTDRKTYT